MENVKFKDINRCVDTLYFMSVLPLELSEGWIADAYENNKNRTKISIEKYILSVLADMIKFNDNIDVDKVMGIVDVRLTRLVRNGSDYDAVIPTTMEKLNNIKNGQIELNLFNLEDILNKVQNSANLLYFKGLLQGTATNPLSKDRIFAPKNKEAAGILATLNVFVSLTQPDDERLKHLSRNISRLLYLFKDIDLTNSDMIITSAPPIMNNDAIANLTITGIDELLSSLENIMNQGSEYLLEYVVEELFDLDNRIQMVQRGTAIARENNPLTESLDVIEISVKEDRFTELAESLFCSEDEELNLEDLYEFYNIAYELAKNEIIQEASSRIITKGTEKVTKKIGNASAKSRGMGSSDSKMAQLKRGARIIDDRASSAINAKIDQVINISKDAKREKIITGKNTVKLGKAIKTVLGIITSAGAAKIALGPVVGGAVTIITALGAYALSKRTEEREKKRILLDLETELKITKEKIEDAKGDNARDQKYQLMRIQTSLEKEIVRIKNNLRYY